MHLWPIPGWGPNVDLLWSPSSPRSLSHLLSRDTFNNFLCAFLSSSWKHSCSCIKGKVDAEPPAIRKWGSEAGHRVPCSLYTARGEQVLSGKVLGLSGPQRTFNGR